MRRREFITLLGGAAAWPLSAQAQQAGRMRRIGVLMGFSEDDAQAKSWVAAFVRGLAELGWKEGDNLRTEYRWAGNVPERIRAHAVELAGLNLEAVLAGNTPTAAALMQASRTLPIVFARIADPIGTGFTSSLARPDSNVTGFSTNEPPMAGKWVSLLKELAPGLRWVGFVHNPATAPYAAEFVRHFETAAAAYGMKHILVPINEVAEIESTIASVAGEPNGSLVVLPSGFTVTNRRQIVTAAEQYRLPAIYASREFIADGGLMSYGPDIVHSFWQTAAYIDRILKGAKPAELPVQTPTKFEWIINLKAAKAIGITIPNSVLLLADETIE
jgi:putative ABC transport system substrate-binding protein